jgi:hypothetical protein
LLNINSEIAGRVAKYGDIKEYFEKEGFILGGNWDYEGGYFDKELSQDIGETVYLRIPVMVEQGMLDDAEALVKFGTPFVVKHVVHTGSEEDQEQNAFMDQTGLSPLLNQFQTPIDTDGDIDMPEYWVEKSQEAINKILKHLQ